MDENGSNNNLSSVSMPDYIIAAKQANWGIDVNELPKLKEIRNLDLNPELNRFLDRLISLDVPWTLDEKKLFEKIWIRMQKIEKYCYIFQPLILVNLIIAFMVTYICVNFFIGLSMNSFEGFIQYCIDIVKMLILLITLPIISGLLLILKPSANIDDKIIREISPTYGVKQHIVDGIVLMFLFFSITFILFFIITFNRIWNWYISLYPWFLNLIFLFFVIALYLLMFLITISLLKKLLIRWHMKQTVNHIVSENRSTLNRSSRHESGIEYTDS